MSISKASIPTDPNKQSSKNNSPETEQYWFNPFNLFYTMLSSHISTQKLHFGMAHYSDNPVELWHSRAWGSSITTVSGEYAYSSSNQVIFPSDFIQIPVGLFNLEDTPVIYGRVVFIGMDTRARSSTIHQIVLSLQPVCLLDHPTLHHLHHVPTILLLL